MPKQSMAVNLIRQDQDPDDVVELAYDLWLARGFHGGSPEEDLLTATRMLGGETYGLLSVPKTRACELLKESRTDKVEKFLSDLKSIEDRKHNLIDDLLRRAAAIKAFDEKAEPRPSGPDRSEKTTKSQHKQPAMPSGEAEATKA